MQSRLKDIESKGSVFGISCDSAFSLDKWAQQEGYTFPLLSDFGKEAVQAYGTMYETLADHKGVPKRSAFLIDGEGKLVRSEISEDAKIIPDLDGFIADMQKL